MTQGSDGSLTETARAAISQALRSRDLSTVASLADTLRQLAAARLFLRRCTQVGRLTRLRGRPRIHNCGVIVIGERVRIHSTTVPIELAAVGRRPHRDW